MSTPEHAATDAGRVLAIWAGAPAVIALIGPADAAAPVITALALRLAAAGQTPRIVSELRDGTLPVGTGIVLVENADHAPRRLLTALAGRTDIFCVLAGTAVLRKRLGALPPLPIVLTHDDAGPAAIFEKLEPSRIWPKILIGGSIALAGALAAVFFLGSPAAPPPQPEVRPVPQPRPEAPQPALVVPPPSPATARPAVVAPPTPAPPTPAPPPVSPVPHAALPALPDGAPLRVRVMYSGDDPYAPALAHEIVPALRERGIVTANAAPGAPSSSMFLLRYFYAEDQAGAERLEDTLNSLLPGKLLVIRAAPTVATRPGDVELAFNSSVAGSGLGETVVRPSDPPRSKTRSAQP